MSVTSSDTTPAQTTGKGASVPYSAKNKVGFVLAVLFSLPNLAAPMFPTPEGEVGPPMVVLVLASVLAAVTVAAVAVGWARGNRAAIRVAAAAIIISAITALPAFFAPDVPAELRAIAAVSVLISIVCVVLMLTPARRDT